MAPKSKTKKRAGGATKKRQALTEKVIDIDDPQIYLEGTETSPPDTPSPAKSKRPFVGHPKVFGPLGTFVPDVTMKSRPNFTPKKTGATRLYQRQMTPSHQIQSPNSNSAPRYRQYLTSQLSEKENIKEVGGTARYDPNRFQWYVDMNDPTDTSVTSPYSKWIKSQPEALMPDSDLSDIVPAEGGLTSKSELEFSNIDFLLMKRFSGKSYKINVYIYVCV